MVLTPASQKQRVPRDHPLRPIRKMVDEILKELSPQFNKMYSKVGRPSIPPEQLLRAQLLQMLYSVRSERLLMEQMDYNILFRWFVGLNMDDAVWDATVFTKNRDRLLEAELAKKFLARVVAQARDSLLGSRSRHCYAIKFVLGTDPAMVRSAFLIQGDRTSPRDT